MAKLLVNNPQGKQEVIEVYEGGGYFDSSRVLWDERQNGPLPDNLILGAMKAVDVAEPVLGPDGNPEVDKNGDIVSHLVRQLIVDDGLRQQALAEAVQESYQAALDECYFRRRDEYPSLSDLADALVHNNLGDPSKLTAYFAQCEAVKVKYPKPQPPSSPGSSQPSS